MAEKVIPLADHRYAAPRAAHPGAPRRADRPAARRAAAGRCATCASRSPTAATSAAATACRRRCSTRTTRSCRTSSLLSFEEITRARAAVRRARRAQDPPHRRRAAAAQEPRAAGRRCWPSCARPTAQPLDLTLTTNGSLLARKAQALKDAGLQRVTVSLDALDDAVFRRMNDADFPVAEVLRRHRRRASAPASARSRSTWSSSAAPTTHEILPMARHFRGTRRRAALHRVHGRRRHQRLAHGRGAALGRGDRAHRRGVRRSSRSTPARAGETAAALALRRRRRRDRRDLERDAGVLPRLQPRAPVDRGQALPVPVRQPRPRPARAAARRRQRRRDRRRDRPDLAAAATTATPSCAARAERAGAPASAASRCTTSADERATTPVAIRPLGAADLAAYKALRDEMLAAHPGSLHLRRRRAKRQGADRLPASPRPRPARAAATSCSAPGAAGACSARSAASASRA